VKENKQLKPTELGFMVTDLLVQSFPGILDVEFTAHMEEELDMIEDGQMEWREAMKEFYGPFKESLEKAKKEMKNVKAEEVPTDITCEKCGSAMVIKWGRKGKFLACSAYPGCKNTKDFTTGEDGKVVPLERTTETTDTPCPTCGKNMIVKSGRFGRFLACPDYPNCKTTKPLSTGIPCPNQDGGMIVERRTKRGRTFFSCSKYPSCTYATWEMPKAEGD